MSATKNALPTSIHEEAITDASAWLPQDLHPGQTWNVSLTDRHVDDLLAALDEVRDLQVAEISRANFPLPACRIESMPVKRLGEPEDVANAVRFFMDEASGFVTGQVLYVCGGVTLSRGGN